MSSIFGSIFGSILGKILGSILGSIFNKRYNVIQEHPVPNIVDDKISLLVKCNLQAKSKFPRLCKRFLMGRYQTLLFNFKMVPQPSSWVEIELELGLFHIVVDYHPPTLTFGSFDIFPYLKQWAEGSAWLNMRSKRNIPTLYPSHHSNPISHNIHGNIAQYLLVTNINICIFYQYLAILDSHSLRYCTAFIFNNSTVL